MCAPVSVTLNAALSLTPILPQIIGIIALAIGSICSFAAGLKRRVKGEPT